MTSTRQFLLADKWMAHAAMDAVEFFKLWKRKFERLMWIPFYSPKGRAGTAEWYMIAQTPDEEANILNSDDEFEPDSDTDQTLTTSQVHLRMMKNIQSKMMGRYQMMRSMALSMMPTLKKLVFRLGKTNHNPWTLRRMIRQWGSPSMSKSNYPISILVVWTAKPE